MSTSMVDLCAVCVIHARISCSHCLCRPMKNTISGNEMRGFMKILVDVKTDKVIGVHMIGPDCAEIMQVMSWSSRAERVETKLADSMTLAALACLDLRLHATSAWHLLCDMLLVASKLSHVFAGLCCCCQNGCQEEAAG